MDCVDFAAFLGVDAPPPSLSPLPQGSVIRFDPGDTEHALSLTDTEAVVLLEQLDYQEITNNQAEELPTRSGGKSLDHTTVWSLSTFRRHGCSPYRLYSSIYTCRRSM